MQPQKDRVFQMLLKAAVLVGAVGCASAPAPIGAGDFQEFADAKIALEQNFTDQDTEVVILAKGLDEGLSKLTVSTADGVKILDLSATKSSLGVREFSVESPEPGLTEVLAAYPEGTYVFEGVTVNGVRLRSTATLSHDLLDPTTLRVDTEEGTISWSTVTGVDHYVLELEREVDGEDVVKLTLEMPSDMTSFPIPAALRMPGEYQVGVAVVSRGGNTTVVEVNFTIEL